MLSHKVADGPLVALGILSRDWFGAIKVFANLRASRELYSVCCWGPPGLDFLTASTNVTREGTYALSQCTFADTCMRTSANPWAVEAGRSLVETVVLV